MGRVRLDTVPTTSSVHACLATVWRGKIVAYQRYIQRFSGGAISSVTLILQSLNGIQDVQHDRAIAADINNEITSPHNRHLILHYFDCYEPGEEDKYHILEKFITEQTRKQSPTERLHAIWCASRNANTLF